MPLIAWVTLPPRPVQKVDAARVPPLRVVLGKVLPDVAEPGRAKQCIDDRVQQHVCVAVPGKPDFVRQLDAAENEIAGLVAAVHVVADAYTHGSAGRLLSFGTHRFEVLER